MTTQNNFKIFLKIFALVGGFIIAFGDVALSKAIEFPSVEITFGRSDSLNSAEDSESLEDRSTNDSLSLLVNFPRTSLVAGERWLKGKFSIKGDNKELEGAILRASVLSSDGKIVGEVVEDLVTYPEGKIFVNVLASSTKKANLQIELIKDKKVVDSDFILLEKGPLIESLEDGQQIPIRVDMAKEYQTSSSAVTFGVSFAPGQLWSTSGLILTDKEGNLYPAQIRSTGEWFRDGSIKWVRIDALVSTDKELFLEYRPHTVSPKGPGLLVEELSDGKIKVHTGGQTYFLGNGKSPIEKIFNGSQEVASIDGARGLYVIDQNGQIGTPSSNESKVTVESVGPIEASIKFEGSYTTDHGEELARYILRAEFYAGNPEVRITHTFIVSKHTTDTWFKEIGFELSVDSGSSAQAFLGISRIDWQKAEKIAFGNGGIERVSILQNDHYHYLTGKNEFTLTDWNKSGQEISQRTFDGEIGGWGAVIGEKSGLLIGSKNAALLHPKEIEISRNKINLLLFSPRGGMELNFSYKSRAKDIDLANLISKSMSRPSPEEAIKKFLSYESDALGWARTHEIVLSPIRGRSTNTHEIAHPIGALNFPIYAYGSPQWIAASGAIGDIHAYDPEQFPEAEETADRIVKEYEKYLDQLGDYGFLDYGSGPHFIHNKDKAIPALKRWSMSYAFRDNLWYLYARRGERSLREFAQRAGRFHADSYSINWDDPSTKKFRGFYIRAEGDDASNQLSPYNFPINWGATSSSDNGLTGDLNKHLLDYYLTGYRRGLDFVKSYGESILAIYTPQLGKTAWRRFGLLNNVVTAYSATWNEKLRDIAENVIDGVYDPESEVSIDSLNRYGSTYKTQSDFKIILRSYQQLRDPRLKEILDQLAEYWSYSFDQKVSTYDGPWGMVSSYLLREKKDVSVGVVASLKLLGMLDPNQQMKVFSAPPNAEFIMNGFAWSEKVVLETGALEKLPAGYSGLNSLGNSFRWFFKHEKLVRNEFRYSFANPNSRYRAANIGTNLQATKDISHYTYNLQKVSILSAERGRLLVPPDALPNEFEIVVTDPGVHAILANDRFPLVLNIEGFWQPLTGLPIFFEVRAEDKGARIYFTDEAKLIAPDGQEITDIPLGTWKSLSQPGMYQMTTRGIVCGENFPPFYAFGDAGFYFVPDTVKPFNFVPKGMFVKDKEGYRASGEPLAFSIETLFPEGNFPKEGTIEFYYRPDKDAVEISNSAPFFRILSGEANTPPFQISYNGNRKSSSPSEQFKFTSRIPVYDFKTGANYFMLLNRPWFFRKGQWSHVAISWGEFGVDNLGNPITEVRVFINGKTGNLLVNNQANREIRLNKPTKFAFGQSFTGDYLSLRFSNRAIYIDDFDPPSPKEIEEDNLESTLGVLDFSTHEWKHPSN